MDKLLVVEPMVESALVMAKLLSGSGYDVFTMQDGTGLLTRISISPPDLIVLNCTLLTTSGFDVCRLLKQNEMSKHIPILMLSNDDDPRSKFCAEQANADDYMVKTTDSFSFVSRVKSLLRIKHLSDQLKLKYAELQEKNKIMDLQLQMAMQVQRSLIQEKDFVFNDLKVVSRYLPALAIGGDFYDFVPLDEECIGIAIGDVSGHGISASLLTSMLHMMIRNYAPLYLNPGQLLYHMNNRFIETFEGSNNNMYASMFYAVINTKKKRIYYANAGQPLPFHMKAKENSVFELESIGMPIGFMKDSLYEPKITLYEENDALLFYTDGLADNFFKDNSEDFYQKIEFILETMLDDSTPNATLEELLNMFYRSDEKENNVYEKDDVSVILCKM